jgi:plasmid stabilization system protein ParE
MAQDFDVYTVKRLPQVEDDLRELTDFYYDCAGMESASRFDGAFEAIVASLGYLPNFHRMFEDNPNVRRIDMPNHKVAIIYLVDNDKLEVLAVKAFHTLQNPEYIKKLISDRLKIAQQGGSLNA